MKALEGKTSPADEKSRKNLEQQLADLGSFKDAQIAQIQAYNKAKESGLSFYGDTRVAFLNWADSLESRQSTIQSAFTNSFSAMEDAFMNFCQGSEVSVKGLFKTILQEMPRVQVKATTTGMSSWLSGLFGAGTTASTPSSDFIGAMNTYGTSGMVGQAKGGAWNNGIKKFAKGGSFTNSVVSSPTLFAFARGTGLMGEAGPEAIMPLTRDGQGNLGVRSQGNNGGNVVITANVNVSDSGTSYSASSDKEEGKKIADTFNIMIAKWVTNEQRNGGVLDRRNK